MFYNISMGKSRYLIGILIGFLVGVYLGDLLKINLAWILGLTSGTIIVLALYWKLEFWRLGILALLGLFLGTFYVQFWQVRQSKITLPLDRELEIQVQVVSHPDFSGSRANYLVSYKGANDHVKIQLQVNRYPEYRYGDILKIRGVIKKPSEYLLHKNVAGQISYADTSKISAGGNLFYKNIYLIRDQFEESLNRIFSEPTASFAAGLILGSKRNIPDSLMQDFNRTGTTHIVAVSGYNVTILVIYLGLLLGIFSRQLKFWGSIFIIIAFVLMTGATASVVRAGILAGLIVFGKNSGRRVSMTILILLTATIMVILNPYLIKYDISFQLSYLAFLGLVYLSPIIVRLKIFSSLHSKIRQTLCETLSAQVMVLPILVYYFGQASIISPVVNVLILWLIPTAMLVVFSSAIFGMISLGLGHLAGIVFVLPLKYMVYVVEAFSKIPWASFAIKTDLWWWMIPYFLATSYLVYIKKEELKKADVQTF